MYMAEKNTIHVKQSINLLSKVTKTNELTNNQRQKVDTTSTTTTTTTSTAISTTNTNIH